MMMLDSNLRNSIECTKSVLTSIAKHLSKNKACRKQIYRVSIGVYDSIQNACYKFYHNHQQDCTNFIFFDTDVKLISHLSTNQRVKLPAIQHIILEHFFNLYAGAANGNQVQIRTEMLIPGIYEYRLSASGKYRKWFRVV